MKCLSFHWHWCTILFLSTGVDHPKRKRAWLCSVSPQRTVLIFHRTGKSTIFLFFFAFFVIGAQLTRLVLLPRSCLTPIFFVKILRVNNGAIVMKSCAILILFQLTSTSQMTGLKFHDEQTTKCFLVTSTVTGLIWRGPYCHFSCFLIIISFSAVRSHVYDVRRKSLRTDLLWPHHYWGPGRSQ